MPAFSDANIHRGGSLSLSLSMMMMMMKQASKQASKQATPFIDVLRASIIKDETKQFYYGLYSFLSDSIVIYVCLYIV
jgi:hypothetical protein